MFMSDLPYFASILLTRVKFTCVRTEKPRDSGYRPLSGKISVCWIGVTLWEVVAHGGSSVSIISRDLVIEQCFFSGAPNGNFRKISVRKTI